MVADETNERAIEFGDIEVMVALGECSPRKIAPVRVGNLVPGLVWSDRGVVLFQLDVQPRDVAGIRRRCLTDLEVESYFPDSASIRRRTICRTPPCR